MSEGNYVMTNSGLTSERRCDVRSNVFLAATIVDELRSSPVRIRNLSSRGALLDAFVGTADKTIVGLHRGRLTARGQISRRSSGQCVIRFDSPIVVAEWARRIGHKGQQQVHEVLAAIRSTKPFPSKDPISNETLKDISEALDGIYRRLASSSRFPCEMSEELLLLNGIAQALRALSVFTEASAGATVFIL